MQCPNCGNCIGCSCQGCGSLQTASDGKQVCSKCSITYENFLLNQRKQAATNASTRIIQNQNTNG